VYKENILSLLITSILVLGSIKYPALWAARALSPGVYMAENEAGHLLRFSAEVRKALLPVYF
jgi:hypothetical protein